jgi:hypothetical protein
MKKTFKNLLVVLVSLAIGVTLSVVPTVFAEDGVVAPGAETETDYKDFINVYLSEPIGAGKEVFHVTRCTKIPKTSSLRCNDQTADKYKDQCKPKPKEKLLTNRIIKQCAKDADREGSSRPGELDNCSSTVAVEAQVWALLGCRGSACEYPNDKKNYGELEFIVAETRPNPEDFSDKYVESKGYDKLAIGRLYELSTCDEGAWFVKDVKPIDGSGPLVVKNPDPNKGSPNGPQYFTEKLGGKCESKGLDLIYQDDEEGKGEDAITCQRKELIQGTTGTGLLSNFIGGLYGWATGIVGLISVLIIVFNGVRIATAGEDTGTVDDAKTRIQDSLIALALLFLSGLLLYTINPNFFVQ